MIIPDNTPFGPPSIVSINGLARPIFRAVNWHRDEPLEPGEVPPPLDLEDPLDTEKIPGFLGCLLDESGEAILDWIAEKV